MLAALAGSGEPFNADVTIGDGCRRCGRLIEDGDGNGRGVNPTTSLSRRHALDAVTPYLVVEGGDVTAANRDRNEAVRASIARRSSTPALAQSEISVGQVVGEQLGVGAALG